MLVLGLAAAAVGGIQGHAQQQAQTAPAGQTQSQAPPAGQAQTPPAAGDGQRPVFRAGINFVRVDVIVSDRNGNPVENLQPDDFEIIEQKQVQKIETFKLIAHDSGRLATVPPRQIRSDFDEETEAARDDVRLFAFFLDDYHVRRETSLSARPQLARFVQTQFGPSDMVGVMLPLQPTDSVRMTRNHEAVMKALMQFEGVKYDYTPRNDIERRYQFYPTEAVEMIRHQVSMSALKALIVRMGGLKEGRKALILVSEGYSYMLPPQLRDAVAGMPGLGNPDHNNPAAGQNNLLDDRAAFLSGTELENDLRDIWDLANRNNVAIYSIDPRGLTTGEFGIDQNVGLTTDRQYLGNMIDSLRTLSLQTDGRAIVNRNDLVVGMRQIVRDTSAYYLLGYNSTFTATDGKFHEIKVNVKRPGLQVRARKGYWAFTAADAARATAPPTPDLPKPVRNALASVSQPSRSRIIRTWIGTEKGENGRTRVTFLWEPAPRIPGATTARSAPPEVPARVSVTAVAPDGSPYFRGRVPDAAPGSTVSPSMTTPSKISFEARPGPMQLRIAVESATADVLDSEIREIAIPDLTIPQTAIGTPAVFRARTLKEVQQLKTDPRAMPTAAREFSRTDRVFLRVTAYAPGVSAPTVTAKLLNRTGQAMNDLAVSVPAAPGAAQDIDLALAPLPPGEYLVEITAAGAGEPVKELVGFRVTG
jgi:VWFA-related protein